MNDPFEDLEADHRVIDKILSALETATPESADVSFFEKVAEFVRDFADGCHHEKEEKHLFPVLVLAGVQQDMGPVGVMLEEHRQGRDHLSRMRDLLDSADLAALCEEGRAYAALMREHIAKEEHALFLIGRVMLPATGAERVVRGFEALDPGNALRKQNERIADALCKQVGATIVATG